MAIGETTFVPASRHISVAMMADCEREDFTREANKLAAGAFAGGGDLRLALAAFFDAAFRQHPDEEDRLLELWAKLTSRQVL